jgi:uncharacterized short protein YbdD (DUF466 family)
LRSNTDFAKESIERWTSNLDPDTRQIDLLIYRRFKNMVGLDPFDLLVESRKDQNGDRIVSCLRRFHEALILSGYNESTADQYYNMMHSYFVKNRVPLRKVEKPRAPVLIANLFYQVPHPVKQAFA